MGNDEFGQDPAVRSMRRVFAQMERLHQSIVGAASLQPLDRRLRVWREQALTLFEQSWNRAAKRGLTRSEEEAALLYGLCLRRILERGRIEVPSGILPRNEALEGIIEELLK